MSAVDTRCSDCGTALGELERDRTGDVLCLTCYFRRYPDEAVAEPTPLPRDERQPRRPMAVPAEPAAEAEYPPTPTSWAPVPLEAVLDGTQADPPPSILTRGDGRALLYAKRVHAVFGEPEACKGWLALAACAEALEAGERVVYVDFEDSASSVVGRLVALGVDEFLIRGRFAYVRPDEPLEDLGRIDLDVAAEGAGLVVL